MADWILWPADALLSAGAYVASWFASKDTPGFLLLQMMMATLVLARLRPAIPCSTKRLLCRFHTRDGALTSRNEL